MLSPQALAIARERIAIELTDRRGTFQREVGRINSEAGSRGALYSSRVQVLVAEAVRHEFEIRALTVLQVLSRVLATQPAAFDTALGRQLKDEIARALEFDCDDVAAQYDGAAKRMSTSGAMKPLADLRQAAQRKADSEVDLSLLAAQSRPTDSGGSVVNIYQPYGIVQTGAGSSATFNQQVGQTERQELDRALAAVAGALQRESDDRNESVAEASEVVGELRAEVSKPSPNMTRVRGGLMAVATTVQALGSAAPAYALLKGAATLIGVHLP